MDELDLLFRDALGYQLIAYIVVHIKAVILGCAEVAENHLGGALFLGLFPDFIYLIHTGIGFTVFIFREQGICQPLIQREFSAIIGDAQHIVVRGFYFSVSNLFCPDS